MNLFLALYSRYLMHKGCTPWDESQLPEDTQETIRDNRKNIIENDRRNHPWICKLIGSKNAKIN